MPIITRNENVVATGAAAQEAGRQSGLRTVERQLFQRALERDEFNYRRAAQREDLVLQLNARAAARYDDIRERRRAERAARSERRELADRQERIGTIEDRRRREREQAALDQRRREVEGNRLQSLREIALRSELRQEERDAQATRASEANEQAQASPSQTDPVREQLAEAIRAGQLDGEELARAKAYLDITSRGSTSDDTLSRILRLGGDTDGDDRVRVGPNGEALVPGLSDRPDDLFPAYEPKTQAERAIHGAIERGQWGDVAPILNETERVGSILDTAPLTPNALAARNMVYDWAAQPGRTPEEIRDVLTEFEEEGVDDDVLDTLEARHDQIEEIREQYVYPGIWDNVQEQTRTAAFFYEQENGETMPMHALNAHRTELLMMNLQQAGINPAAYVDWHRQRRGEEIQHYRDRRAMMEAMRYDLGMSTEEDAIQAATAADQPTPTPTDNRGPAGIYGTFSR